MVLGLLTANCADDKRLGNQAQATCRLRRRRSAVAARVLCRRLTLGRGRRRTVAPYPAAGAKSRRRIGVVPPVTPGPEEAVTLIPGGPCASACF